MTKHSHLAGLLLEAFPAVERLPGDCWIRCTIETGYTVWDEAVDEVNRNGGRAGAIQRLRDEHPLDREHVADHDSGVVRVFTEIEAFAWTSTRSALGVPHFVFVEGAPDLRVPDRAWIEAKTIQSSDADRARWDEARENRDPDGIVMRVGTVSEVNPALVRKADAHLRNAVTKWERQARDGEFVTFICVSEIDVGTDWDDAFAVLRAWAARAEAETGVQIVLIHNHHWADPFYGST